MIDALRLTNAQTTDIADALSSHGATPVQRDMSAMLSSPQVRDNGLTRDEVKILAGVARDLHPSDCEILIRLIDRVAVLERTYGEDIALAMLESATEYFAKGKAPN